MNILQDGLVNAKQEAVAKAEEYPAVKAAFDAIDIQIDSLGIDLQAGNKLKNMLTDLHIAAAEAAFGLGLTAGFKLSNEVRDILKSEGSGNDGQ